MNLQREIIEKLKEMGEGELVKKALTNVTLSLQIQKLDLKTIEEQKKALFSAAIKEKTVTPLQTVYTSGNANWQQKGEKLLQGGKAAVLIVAGGQGSRLGFEGPKGCFPTTVIKKKSLFQIFVEKTKSATEKYHQDLQMAFMVSPLNERETLQFFSQHHHFGLPLEQIHFFTQPMWPFLDLESRLICDEHGIVSGPNGNGAAFRSFVNSSVFEKWKKKQIQYVMFLQIDNPLGDPFDSELLGFCNDLNCEVAIKGVHRKGPEEKVGLIVEHDKKIEVVEYSELSSSQKKSKELNLANISCFCFTLEFIENMSEQPLPMHFQKKKTPSLTEAWKFEQFIFDALPFSKKTEVLVYPREEVFAPLKNLYGEDSIFSVQSALGARDREIWKALTETFPPDEKVNFELDTRFYYPTERTKEKWRGKKVEGGYLEA